LAWVRLAERSQPGLGPNRGERASACTKEEKIGGMGGDLGSSGEMRTAPAWVRLVKRGRSSPGFVSRDEVEEPMGARKVQGMGH